MANKTYIQEKLMGTPGQVVSFDNNNKAIVKSLDPILGATLYVTAQYGAIVTASDGISTLTASNDPQLFIPVGSDSFTTADNYTLYSASNNVYTLNIPRIGNWLVTSTAAGVSTSEVININGAGDFYLTVSPFKAYIVVSFPISATCKCSDGITTLVATNTDGFYTFEVPNPGVWSVTAFTTTESKTMRVTVNSAGQEIPLAINWIDSILEYNNWDVIQHVTQMGTATLYWSVGDCKAITIDGTVVAHVRNDYDNDTSAVFDNETVYAFILGFDHNAAMELKTSQSSSSQTPGITFQIGKTAMSNGIDICFTDNFYNTDTEYGGDSLSSRIYSAYRMAQTRTNAGGWRSSWMRRAICGNPYTNSWTQPTDALIVTSFKDLLPSDLQAVLRTATKYTDNNGSDGDQASSNVSGTADYLYLPAEFEIFGVRTHANNYEQNKQLQFDYYINNSKVKYMNADNTTAARWWLRSPTTGSYNFVIANSDGTVSSYSANYSYGFAPCFTVG